MDCPLAVDDISTLIAAPPVAAISFTGSSAAGRQVAAQAGQAGKPCVLELGGSDPYIILPGAELEQAVQHCLQARLINNGQSCIAAKRLIVHQDCISEGSNT